MANPLNTIAYSGTIPAFYDSILGPLYFQPYAEYLGEKIASVQPKKILELACGTGRLTREIAQRLPDAMITATDINPSMLAHAQQTLKEFPHVHWSLADATELNFENNSFDCIAVQFGVMFYGADKVKGFKAAYDVLEKEGSFIFSAWNALERNPVAAITQSVIAEFFPTDTPSFYQVPFAYNDPEKMEDDLANAGFEYIAIELLPLEGYCRNAAEAAKGLIEGTPAHTAIMERDPAAVLPLEKRLEEKLTERYGKNSFEPELEAYIVVAKK